MKKTANTPTYVDDREFIERFLKKKHDLTGACLFPHDGYIFVEYWGNEADTECYAFSYLSLALRFFLNLRDEYRLYMLTEVDKNSIAVEHDPEGYDYFGWGSEIDVSDALAAIVNEYYRSHN